MIVGKRNHRRLRLAIAVAAMSGGAFFATFQEAGPLNAQEKQTRLPDGVIRYEASTSNLKPPSFWELFSNMFQTSPTKRPFEKSFAFLTGVSTYKYLRPQLPYVMTDLEELRNFLISKAGFDVVYVATDDKVTVKLVEDYMLNRFPREIGENDRLLFYYSGHGGDIGGGTGYMEFSQAKQDHYDSDQYLEVTRTQEWSRVIKVKHILFILDSCASGLFPISKQGSSNLDQNLLNTLSGAGSRFVITAGKGHEKAFAIEVSSNKGYSIFTHSFLDALRSSDSYEQRGFTTLSQVFAETEFRVKQFSSATGKTMTPETHDISIDEKDNGTFIFLNKDFPAASIPSRSQAALGIVPKAASDTLASVSRPPYPNTSDNIEVNVLKKPQDQANTLTLQTRTTNSKVASTLTGFVTAENGERVSNAKITLVRHSAKWTEEKVTGPDGMYRFYALAPGRYSLRVDAPGYKVVEQEVDMPEIGLALQKNRNAPTVAMSAKPARIRPGQTTRLYWASSDATELTIAPGVGAVMEAGSTEVKPSESTTYTITVIGPGGSATTTATVTVQP